MPKNRTIVQLLEMYDALMQKQNETWREQETVMYAMGVPKTASSFNWEQRQKQINLVTRRSAFTSAGLLVLQFRPTEYDHNMYIGVDKDIYGGWDDMRLASKIHPEWTKTAKPGNMELLTYSESWKIYCGYSETWEPMVLEHERLSSLGRQYRFRAGVVSKYIQKIMVAYLEENKIGPYLSIGNNRYRLIVGERVLSMENGNLSMSDLGKTVNVPESRAIEYELGGNQENKKWRRREFKNGLLKKISDYRPFIPKNEKYKTIQEVYVGS